jgi:predicted  nucleic acid-binding Zn-ribbon protein
MSDTDFLGDLWTSSEVLLQTYQHSIASNNYIQASCQPYPVEYNTVNNFVQQQTKQTKSEERKKKNRISARLSREKQRNKMKDLQEAVHAKDRRINELSQCISSQTDQIALLNSEIEVLRKNLAEIHAEVVLMTRKGI